MFDYSELRGRIRAKFGTEEAFAKAIGMSKGAVSWRLNNRTPWKPKEILNACAALQINKDDMMMYFFSDKIQKN